MIASPPHARFVNGALALSALLLGACGVPQRSTLPRGEANLLALAPETAFFAARIDGERIRALPAWERFEQALDRQDDELARMARGADRIFVVVGGTVAAPPAPPETDEAGNYVERPAWVEVSRGLGGRIPQAILVVHGPVASTLCGLAREVGEAHETRGYRWSSNKGIAVVEQDAQTCLFTFVPVFEALVARGPAPLPAAVRRLGTLGHGEDLGLASAVLDLDSGGFEDILESAGPTPETDADGARVSRALRRIFAAFAHGIADVEWSLHVAPGGYEGEARIIADDRARGVMYREFTEIYFEILRTLVETEVVPEEAREQLRTLYEGFVVEARPDGYSVRASVEERTVSTILDAMIPMSESGFTQTATAAEVVGEPLYYQVNGSAAETIAVMEERSAELEALSPYDSLPVRRELADAYASVGRFEDARRQLRAALGTTEETQDGAARVRVQAQRCRLELTAGDAQAALSVVADARTECDTSYCGDDRLLMVACEAQARALLGEVDEALGLLEFELDLGSGSDVALALVHARARILLDAGRWLEAASTAHAYCFARGASEGCAALAALEAEALARSDAPLDRVLDHVTRVRDRYVDIRPLRIVGELEVALMRAECLARISRNPQDAGTLSTCEDALQRALELQGEQHPATLATRIASARAFTAARNATAAAEQLTAVDAALSRLGPNTPVRRERAAIQARPTRRPR